MPVPPPTEPSSTGPAAAASSAGSTCSRVDVAAVDVVQVAVPGLGGDRQHPRLGERGMARDDPVDDRLVRDPDRVRVRDRDRQRRSCPDSSIQLIPVISPLPFEEYTPAAHGSPGLPVPATRMDRGHAGADAVALDQRA